jgi:hypothetical protein
MDAPPCPGCRQRDETIAELRLRLTALEARVRDLEDQLGRNATNSSLPPSANPLGAPKLPPKKPTGRKTGAQPGHPAHLRRRLPPERLQHTRDFIPRHCQRCHELLPPGPGPDDPEPTWHRSFGSQSESGCRWVERMLTVVQTRRLQGRPVLDYVYEALVAHRAGLPAPKLL